MTTPDLTEARIQAAALRTLDLDATAATMDALADELERLRALVAPAQAAAESLRYLGGTLHAQRLEDAIAAATAAGNVATAQQAEALAESREYKHAMGDWLGAVGELIEAMGRPKFSADAPVAVIAEAIREAAKRLAAPSLTVGERGQPRLTVRLQSFPESNGKRNWTALLVRTEEWGGLVGNCGGISIAHGELWNRVAYEAERAKLLIGERDTEPHILDYGDDIQTPDQWLGEVRGGRPVKQPSNPPARGRANSPTP